jgi:hypothetical protein
VRPTHGQKQRQGHHDSDKQPQQRHVKLLPSEPRLLQGRPPANFPDTQARREGLEVGEAVGTWLGLKAPVRAESQQKPAPLEILHGLPGAFSPSHPSDSPSDHVSEGSFPTAPLRTARDSFAVKQLSSGRRREGQETLVPPTLLRGV